MRRYTLNISDREFVVDVQEIDADNFEVVVGGETYQVNLANEENLAGATITPGFAPNLASHAEGLQLVVQAIEAAGYFPGEDVLIGLDCAASEFFKDGKYQLAGEGLRRADIVRWQEDGKMLAEKVMNGDLLRVTGTINYGESEPTKRAEITGTAVIETRQFSSRNRYLPIPQTSMDKNPNLKQNPGY